ncbi:MAG TPA: T9SS type A sorting domain-containing protein [Candidatus Kapabacteria bacterium]|nr:T9SS type A sorting domain-containing protein [Candidatus Kapabacteria bacterium]
MSLIRILFYSVLLLASASLSVHGQTYQWQLGLRGDFRSVAFNSRSNGRTIFAGPHGGGGIWRSDDGGMTWVLHNTGISPFSIQDVRQVLCIPSDTNIVLAVTPTRLYRSTDGGLSWSDTSSLGGADGEAFSYHDADSTLYYGQNAIDPLTTWESTDFGLTWIPHTIEQGGGFSELCTVAASPDTPPVLLSGSGDSALVERSTDYGTTWTIVATQDSIFGNGAEVPKIVFSDHAINAGHHGIALVTRWLSRQRSMLQTTDGGITWTNTNSPNRYVWAIDIDQRAVMIGQQPNGSTFPLHFWTGLFFNLKEDAIGNDLVDETTDGGLSWIGTNFPSFIGSIDTGLVKQVWVLKYDTLSGKIAVATDAGIFVTNTRLGVKQIVPVNTAIDITHTTTTLRIDNSGEPIESVELYDILGRLMFQTESKGSIYQIGTTNFSAGVYLLKINLSSGPPYLKLLSLP